MGHHNPSVESLTDSEHVCPRPIFRNPFNGSVTPKHLQGTTFIIFGQPLHYDIRTKMSMARHFSLYITQSTTLFPCIYAPVENSKFLVFTFYAYVLSGLQTI